MASESSTLSKCAIQNTNADKNRDAAPVSLLDKLVRASNALQLAMILLVIVLWLSVFWMHRQPSDTVQGHVRHSADKEVRTSPNSSQPVDVGTVGTSESIVQVAPGFAPDSAGPRERSSARPALSSKPPQAPQRSQPQVRQVNEKSPLPQPGTAPLASEGRERSIAEFSGSAEQRGLFRSRTQQGSALDLRTFRNLLFDRKERSRNNIPKMKQVQQTRTSAAVKLSRQITPPKAHKLVQPTSSKTSTPISATVPKLAKQKSVPKMHRLVGSGRCKHGTCNEELSRCDCPVNRTGVDCSEPAMPECELIPGYEVACSAGVPLSCACFKACYRAWGGEGAIPGTQRVCYEYEPAAPPESVSYTIDVKAPGVKWKIFPLPSNSPELMKALPLSSCPKFCSFHGWCSDREKCICFAGYEGALCESWSSRTCLGDCSSRGMCHNGFCQCNHGFWGVDCSISWGPDPKAPVLWNKTTKGSRRPYIYIYDLPPQFDTWYTGHRKADRPVGTLMLDRLLNSEYRTPDPETADLFFVPFNPRKSGFFKDVRRKFLDAWEYVEKTWTYLEKAGGRDHLQVITGDYGITDHFNLKEVPASISNAIFLQHNGNIQTGNFRLGHDVNVPPLQHLDDKTSPLFGGKRHARGNRSTLLFFAGGIMQPERARDGNVRTAVFLAHNATAGFDIINGRVKDYNARMASSVFCLAPPGTDGRGWGRRTTLAALHGCIPVIIQDNVRQPLEELLPYDAFSVRVSEANIPRLDQILRGYSASAIAEMQRHLACAAPRWLFSTVYGAYGNEDGSQDAVESVLQTLMRRIKFHGSSVLDDGGPMTLEASLSQMRLTSNELCSARADYEEPRPCPRSQGANGTQEKQTIHASSSPSGTEHHENDDEAVRASYAQHGKLRDEPAKEMLIDFFLGVTKLKKVLQEAGFSPGQAFYIQAGFTVLEVEYILEHLAKVKITALGECHTPANARLPQGLTIGSI
ncbi:hypothetical protein CYMTET_37107 [Cymbomonas tetramitiformis]|uniref:EGF-like domain-containing protein n=1 Tax=Cymbomonas tetramitiformis TaxID=36881 RepID=A0AAE0CEP5_9CHLO|nr:hypothetical protein CYMTET_37107 [Cymbomonas tetramitiformis]